MPEDTRAAGTARTVRTPSLEIAYEERGRRRVPVGAAPRVPRRRPRLRRRGAAARRAGMPRARALPARVRPTRFLDAASRAGRSRPRSVRTCSTSSTRSVSTRRPRRLRLGRPRRVHRRASWRPSGCAALVTIGGYNVQNTLAAPAPASAIEERALLVPVVLQHRARAARARRRTAASICRLLWQDWSPGWRFDDETFERTAARSTTPTSSTS